MPKFESKGASEVVLPQPLAATLVGTGSPDACDLLITELAARRVRFENLLHAVWLEVERAAARRVPDHTRAKCCKARGKRTA